MNNPRSMQNFVRELEELNIYDRLETPLNTNPQENYLNLPFSQHGKYCKN